ncbi:MAG: YjjG family noncanonical pyrimidine nucleotidase [Bacteroidales bacterium]|nr:YjjG family noncanonical pyrimidine nucleotidase [Bacteroidales bacterium]
MVKHILFDLDHTLFDFNRNSFIALRMLYMKFGLKKHFHSLDSFLSTYKTHNILLWQLFAKNEVDKEGVSVGRFYRSLCDVGVDNYALARQMADFYLRTTSEQKRLMPYALATLRYLYRRPYKISIITNGFVEAQYRKINNCGLSHFMTGVFISEEIGAKKPTPEFFDAVFKSLDTNASECVVVGDSMESDIQGAVSLGIRAILYNPDNNPIDADVEQITSLRDLQMLF